MYEHIKSIISQVACCDAVLERPKNREFGHFATPVAFTLAKAKKLSPETIASDLCKQLEGHSAFAKVAQVKGYINLTLADSLLEQFASSALAKKHIESSASLGISESILLEYVSANPTGPLHIGHARGAVLGDSLQRLGSYLGHHISSEYYVNDAGAQIGKLGRSIYLAGREILGDSVEYDDECYKGEYIIDIAKSAIARFGQEIMVKEQIPTLSDFGKDLMLQEIKDNLAACGIHFDKYVSERELFTRWDSTLERLKAHQGVYEQDSKLWLASSKKGDEKDRVIVRDDGEPTYLAGDIIYHGDKFSRDFSRYINIWGADHHGYIARVKASIEYLGYDSSRLLVLLAQMVSLLKDGKPYKMSKRAGNFILMRDVLADIGSDALRFVFLSKKPDTHLEFDVATLSKQDSSNPVFYINYANARIHTLLKKSSLEPSAILQADLAQKVDSSKALVAARELVFEALLLPRVAQMAWEEKSLQKVCEYAKSLAGDFHAFYNAHKILESTLQAPLLKASMLVSLALTQALDLLGIEAKTQM